MKIRIGFALLCVALTLAGCGSLADSFSFMERKEKPIRRDLFPASFKTQILRTVPSVVADRAGIRDAYYSEPAMDPGADTYASCVRFNARDGGGQYVGVKDYIAYYYNGALNQFVAAEDRCKAASYKPFPELENLCPGGKCSP
jgi:hypothetical protein